ncbi:MAG: hypothetical protein ACERKO_01430 [Acetanaerobacterium sp.]
MLDRSTEVLYSILGYIGILVMVPILAGKDSEFCKFHSNQGLLLLLGEVGAMALRHMGDVMFPLGAAGFILGLACFVFAIIGIVGAARQEMNPLPFIGQIRILK